MNRIRTIPQLVLIVGLLWVHGCASPGEVDRALAVDAALEMKSTFGYYDNETVHAYVQRIGHALAALADDEIHDYRFDILDDTAPNAFALPDGQVYVTRGLLSLVSDEHELAAVIAHEIQHVKHRHASRRIDSGFVPGILRVPGEIFGLAHEGLGDLLAGPFRQLQIEVIASYSRDQELEADAEGLALLADAGYDPNAMARILDKLDRVEQLYKVPGRTPGFTARHPRTDQRTELAEGYAFDLVSDVDARVVDPTVHRIALTGMTVGPNPARGLFLGNRFLHPRLDFRLFFPEGWFTTRTASIIAAVSPDSEGVMMMDRVPPDLSVEEYGGNFVQTLEDAGYDLARTKRHDLNGHDAYTVYLKSEPVGEGDEAVSMILRLTWVAKGEDLYRIIVLVPPHLVPATDEAIATFGTLSVYERQIIDVGRLYFATAQPGETLEDLTRRTKNAWPTDLTLIVNALADEHTPLADGQVVKIVRRLGYESE